MNQTPAIQSFLQTYLNTLPEGKQAPLLYEIFSFCNNRKDADKLGDLVLRGIKTATSSLVWMYAAEESLLPQIGNISLVTNWDGDPLCVIETLEVRQLAFEDVDSQMAADEGEGDRSLRYWKEAHWPIFAQECARIGHESSPTMPVLYERFRVVYPLRSGSQIGVQSHF
jgi:uncharacterized protein YhfF